MWGRTANLLEEKDLEDLSDFILSMLRGNCCHRFENLLKRFMFVEGFKEGLSCFILKNYDDKPRKVKLWSSLYRDFHEKNDPSPKIGY